MTLVGGKPGVYYLVKSIAPEYSAVLGDLGVYEGKTLKVISALALGGPLILDLGSSQLAVDRCLAGTIAVQTCAGPSSSVIL